MASEPNVAIERTFTHSQRDASFNHTEVLDKYIYIKNL
jgi:hypothetical protein